MLLKIAGQFHILKGGADFTVQINAPLDKPIMVECFYSFECSMILFTMISQGQSIWMHKNKQK